MMRLESLNVVLDIFAIGYGIMRVRFGRHNPVDRRRLRHEIDSVILSTCVLQVRRISFLDPSSQKTLLRMTTREKTLLRMTTREKTLLRMTTREITLLRMTELGQP